MDFDEVVALLCEAYDALPSAIYQEDCPRLFRIWRKLCRNRLDQTREDRLWSIAIAPLYQSVMSKEGAKSQTHYRDNLTRSVRDPEEVRMEDEYNSQRSEKRLKTIGVDIVKH